MSGAALYQDYHYLRPSSLVDSDRTLSLATCTNVDEHPHFFRGTLVNPGRFADLLGGLMQVVQARFHVPAAMLGRLLALADPVVTCSDDRLRFEGFSGCCGVYARVDFLPPSVRGETFGRGTTNVDFNQPMLFALAKLRDADQVMLSVGSDEVALQSDTHSVIEKKVQLPVRWLKGFVEVQACQARMELVHQVSALEARRFLRSLPRMKTNRRPTWIVSSGRTSAAGSPNGPSQTRGLRSSQVESSDGVRVGGLERLRVLEKLSSRSNLLRIYSDRLTGASAWELSFDDCRFHLVISPEVWRGFSGEGQALQDSATSSWKDQLASIRVALKWEAIINAKRLAERLDCDESQIAAALGVLGTRGMVGYDLSESAYFHRELPFDLQLVDKLQPRLRAARKLLESDDVRVTKRSDKETEVAVASGNIFHRVCLTAQSASCTCPWYSKHQNTRGPCKHILAAQIVTEGADHD